MLTFGYFDNVKNAVNILGDLCKHLGNLKLPKLVTHSYSLLKKYR